MSDLGDDFFSIGASILFCKLCECKINSDRMFNVTQHVETDKNIEDINREQDKIKKKKQQSYLETFNKNQILMGIFAKL